LLKELFGIFADSKADAQRRKDAVCFIQQSCAALKTIQPAQQRVQMFQSFIGHGLFHVIAFALAHPEASIRVSGSDIMMAILEHDVNLIKNQIIRALSEGKSKPLLDVLIDLLLVETDLGVQTQIVDALRFLLDPVQQQPPAPLDAAAGQRSNFEFMAKLRSNALSQPDLVLAKYYEECAKRVFQPLRDLEKRENGKLQSPKHHFAVNSANYVLVNRLSVHEASLLSQLLELLTHLTRQYAQRAKPWLLVEPLAPRVAQLLGCPEKHLKLCESTLRNLKYLKC
jgi:protein phosphatase 4 regulatory subunit 3